MGAFHQDPVPVHPPGMDHHNHHGHHLWPARVRHPLPDDQRRPGSIVRAADYVYVQDSIHQYRFRVRKHHLRVHRDRVPRRRRPHPVHAQAEGRLMIAQTAPATNRTAPPPAPVYKPRRRKPSLYRTLSRVLIMLIVIVQVYPLAWLFLTSLRTEQDFATGDPFALPGSLTWENYARAFETGDLGRNILNSFIVTMGANLLIVLF